MSSEAKRRKLDIQQDQENPLMEDDKEFRLLPELLKMILIKAVLVQMYSKDMAKRQSDEYIFSNLASVAFLWWSFMETFNFRNKIRHLSKVYFQKAKVRSTIIRNNRNFLKEVIQPDRIIFPMESCGCLTEDEARFLTRLRNDKDKNHQLLIMLQDFSSEKYSKMIDCLFLENQTPAALVLERGGEAVEVHISNGKAKGTKESEIEFIERFKRMQKAKTLIFDDLSNTSVRISLDDVFLLHAKQNKGIEVWLWCKTESSLNQLKSSSDDDLREITQRIYQRLNPQHKITLKPELIQMNYNLASDFAERRLSSMIRHVRVDENLTGFAINGFHHSECITTFADKIYVAQGQEILVYKNKYPYHALDPILFDHVDHEGDLNSIVSCTINKCLYVSFSKILHMLIFKVEIELDNRVSEWLSANCVTLMSVTSKGDVLVFQFERKDNMLQIFTPEGTVKRTIPLKYDSLFRLIYIQEIIPDVVALALHKFEGKHTYVCIKSLDEDGTIFRRFNWQQKISSLNIFRCGDMIAGYNFLTNGAGDILDDDDYVDDDYNEFGIVRLHQWPFKSKTTRDLLKTDDYLHGIHFSADQKQLFVLSAKKLQIYELKYEDEDCDA